MRRDLNERVARRAENVQSLGCLAGANKLGGREANPMTARAEPPTSIDGLGVLSN
jgi:hypothetical protein